MLPANGVTNQEVKNKTPLHFLSDPTVQQEVSHSWSERRGHLSEAGCQSPEDFENKNQVRELRDWCEKQSLTVTSVQQPLSSCLKWRELLLTRYVNCILMILHLYLSSK